MLGASSRREEAMLIGRVVDLQKVSFVVEEAVKDRFHVNGTGELKLKMPLDYETQTSYKFIVWVTDGLSVSDTYLSLSLSLSLLRFSFYMNII